MALDPSEMYPADLLSIVHPDNWDGHVLGGGDVCGDMARPGMQRPSAVGERLAEIGLLEHIAPPERQLIAEQFRPGDQFDPATHPPGTVVRLDIEQAYAYNPLLTDPRRFTGVARPTNDLEIGRPHDYYLGGHAYRYLRCGALGITRTVGKPPLYVALPVGRISRVDSEGEQVVGQL